MSGIAFLQHIVLSKEPTLLQFYSMEYGKFQSKEERKIFDVINNHFSRYGKLPDLQTVEVEAEFEFRELPREPTQYWKDLLVESKVDQAAIRGIGDIQTHLKENDYLKVRSAILDMYKDICINISDQEMVDIPQMIQLVVDAHDKRQRSCRMSGIPTGIPTLDLMSDGLQAGDFIVMVGRPSKGKSAFLLYLSYAAHRGRKKVLWVSFEMPILQVSRRISSLATGTPINAIRFGRMQTWQRDRLVDSTNHLEDGWGFHSDVEFKIMKGGFSSTVEELSLVVQQFRPDILFVDGAYLLHTRQKNLSRFERTSATAEALKELAQLLEIPIVVSYQFHKRSTGKTQSIDDIYMSDVIGQLASIALGIEPDEVDTSSGEKEDKSRVQTTLNVMKGREGEEGEIRIEVDFTCGGRIKEIPGSTVGNHWMTDSQEYEETDFESDIKLIKSPEDEKTKNFLLSE